MRIIQVRDVSNVGRNLTVALSRAGHEVEHILLAEDPERRLWLKMLRLPRRIPEVLRLNARIRAGHYDIVHLHAGNSGWMAALGGYPYFLHCHGSEVRSGLHQPLRRGLARYGLRHAIHVFYVSPELYEHIRPYRPDATLLPNPVDTELFAPGEQLSGRVRVLLAAPLTAVKGPEILYQAVRLLREELPGVEMDVAAFGFGRDLGRYQELLHVPGITSLPPRPHDEMATLFNAYDIILGQTRLGILSLVELEAMACGKPIVCFCDPQLYARDYPEPPPVLSGHTPEAIAEHLRALIADPSFRLERGRLARAWVVRYHGFDPVTRELLSHYEAYLRSRQRVV